MFPLSTLELAKYFQHEEESHVRKKHLQSITDYGEIRELRRTHEDLWVPVSDLLRKLAGAAGH